MDGKYRKYFKTYLLILYVWMLAYMSVWVHVHTYCLWRVEGVWVSLELELQMSVSYHVYTGNQAPSSLRAVRAHTPWAISPASKHQEDFNWTSKVVNTWTVEA